MITYEVYLTCVKLGLNPLPANPEASEICNGITCEICPLNFTCTFTYTCTSDYFIDSKTHYPILLTQNPELAL